MERIYNTLKGQPLQHWLTIAIIRDETGSATVETRSTIHVVKARIGISSWCNEWNTLSIDHDKTDRDTSFKCECCGERIHGEKLHLVLANFRN